MRSLAWASRVLVPGLLMIGLLALPARAQDDRRAPAPQQTNSAEIQRLQDLVYDVGTDVARVRSYDPAHADQLQGRLDDLRDEVIYLKVKQRKEGVARSEFSSVRTQLDDLRAEARNAIPGANADNRPMAGDRAQQPGQARGSDRYPPPAPPSGRTTDRDNDAANRPARQGTTGRADEVPAGTELDVRLENGLSSGTAQVEDRFTATTVADLYNGNRLLIPAGSAVRGVVTSVNKAGRVDRTGKLTLAFDRVTVNGRSYPMHGVVTEALESGGYRQDAGKIGAGAGVGAILGGILGGLRGALAGILIGGGGVVAATEGKDVDLPAGTVLRIRIDSPLTVR